MGSVPQAHASSPARPAMLQANATPTAGAGDVRLTPATGGGGVNAPLPQTTTAAGQTATAGANPVATGQPQAVPTGGAAGNSANSTTSSSGGNFPWLIVIGVLLLILAGIGFAMMRPRNQAPTTTTARSPAGTGPGAATTTTT